MEQFDQFVQKWLSNTSADLVFGMDRNRFQTHIRAGNGVHAVYLESRKKTEGHFKHWICTLNPMHRKILSLEKSAFEHPGLKKLFTNSHMVKREILERYQVDAGKIEVIHNGVEWHEMENDFSNWPLEKRLFLEKHALPKDSFHFLFVGHGYQRKGLLPLLRAFSLLRNEEIHLSVVGKERHLPFFLAEAKRLCIQEKVSFFGAQKEIRPFYQMADALVIPSFYDPFANVTVEALAMGLFVVSSRHNGGSEVLAKQNGCIIEELTDPDSLAAALKEALLHPKTMSHATATRASVASLDFSKQLTRLIDACE